MSDTDTFVDAVIVWIALSVLVGVIIYAYWPSLAILWISENLIVLALAGLFRGMSPPDAFAGFAFVWIIVATLSSVVINAYWSSSLAIAWMIETLVALALVGSTKTPSMEKGPWVWSPDERSQRRMTKKVSESKHLMAALEAIMKRKEGLSNAELDDLLSGNSEWVTHSVMSKLLSLGFVEYQVDMFGNPGRYVLTDLGRDIMQKVTGQAVKPPAQVAHPSTPPRPVASPPVVAKPETKPTQP